MSKTKVATVGILGLAFLFAGAAPAFAATQGHQRTLAAAPQGVVAAAPQVAPVVAPFVAPAVKPTLAPLVMPELKPVVAPMVAPGLVIAPDVHPTVGLPGPR